MCGASGQLRSLAQNKKINARGQRAEEGKNSISLLEDDELDTEEELPINAFLR